MKKQIFEMEIISTKSEDHFYSNMRGIVLHNDKEINLKVPRAQVTELYNNPAMYPANQKIQVEITNRKHPQLGWLEIIKLTPVVA
jgi:hypothetical protein